MWARLARRLNSSDGAKTNPLSTVKNLSILLTSLVKCSFSQRTTEHKSTVCCAGRARFADGSLPGVRRRDDIA